MNGATYIHRHFKQLDALLYMYNITFCLTKQGKIDIRKLTLHPINQGIVDHNIIPDDVLISDKAHFNVLKMLYADGVIQLPLA